MSPEEPNSREEVYDKGQMLEGNRYGFGDSPAIVVVDLQNGETDPEHPMGSDLSEVIEMTNELADVAHEKDVPIVWVRVMYQDEAEAEAVMWTKKLPSIKNWTKGSYWVEYDDRLDMAEDDFRMNKVHASCFAGTHLETLLTAQDVDTVIITGCSTSACIRATADDASSLGYHTIVPETAVGDRSQQQHEAHIWDIDKKFADVESVDTVKEYLERL